MNQLEELIRDSLHNRAQDVEATPQLWPEVQRRADRRRRLTWATWGLAAAAAVVVAVVALPTLVSMFQPDTPEILPVDEVPVGPGSRAPTHAVTADADGNVVLRDLQTGDVIGLGTSGQVHDIAVRPGSTAESLEVAVASVGADGPMLHIMSHGAGAAESTMTMLDGDGPASVAWSADGEWLAWLDRGAADADGNIVAYAPFVDGELGLVQDLAVIDGEVRLTGWTGPTQNLDDRSLLWHVREDGAQEIELFLREDGFEAAEVVRLDLEGVVDYVPVEASADGRAGYALRDAGDGAELVRIDDDGSTTGVSLAGDIVDAESGTLRLAAYRDGVAVTNGERAWLLTLAGGDDVQMAALEGTVAAIDVFRSEPEAEPTPEPTADPTSDPEAEPTADPDDSQAAPTAEGAVLIAEGPNLDILDADGRRTVYTFPEEGHSTIVSLAVRPGSTVDDITAVALTTAEGMYDLRTIRVVDGKATQEVFPDQYRPGSQSTAAVDAYGPVWAPDGSAVAWIEGAGDSQTLRTVGWDDGPGTGDDATDNAAFDLPGQMPLVPMQWEEVADGRYEIWATWPDSNEGWYAIQLERQADGAWAQEPGTNPVEVREAPSSGAADPVAAVAGVPGTGEVNWMVRNTFDGAVLVGDPNGDPVTYDLPDEVQSTDGLPFYRLRTMGGGVLVSGESASVWMAPGEDPVVVNNTWDAAPIR